MLHKLTETLASRNDEAYGSGCIRVTDTYGGVNVAKYEQRIDSRLRLQIREEGRRAWDLSCDAWSYIIDDAAARGWPRGSSGTGRGGGPIVMVESETGDMVAVAVTSVEAAAFHPDPYGAWLRDWRLTRAAVLRSADGAASLFSNNPAMEQAKANAVEHCVVCDQEVGTGTAMKIHRVDGQAACASTCYYVMDRRARAAGTTIGVQVAAVLALKRIHQGKAKR